MRTFVAGAAGAALVGALYARLTGFRALHPDLGFIEAAIWSVIVALSVWSVVKLALTAVAKSINGCLLGVGLGVGGIVVSIWVLNGFTFELFSKAVRTYSPSLALCLALAALLAAVPSRRVEFASRRLALPMSLGLASIFVSAGIGLYASGVLNSAMAYGARQFLLVAMSVTLPLLLIEASAQLAPAGRQRAVGRALAVLAVVSVVMVLPPRV